MEDGESVITEVIGLDRNENNETYDNIDVNEIYYSQDYNQETNVNIYYPDGTCETININYLTNITDINQLNLLNDIIRSIEETKRIKYQTDKEKEILKYKDNQNKMIGLFGIYTIAVMAFCFMKK